MTREEIKQICQIYDNLRREREAATIAYNSDDAFWEHVLTTCKFAMPFLPSNLDEAAEEYALDIKAKPFGNLVKEAFKAGAEWAIGQLKEE